MPFSPPFEISWEPEAGYIILLPSQLPSKTEAGIILPKAFVTKNNSGVCVKISTAERDQSYKRLLGLECLFPPNQEYRIHDSDLDVDYYVIHADHIVMARKPPKKTEFVRIEPLSRERGEDVGDEPPEIATLQHHSMI